MVPHGTPGSRMSSVAPATVEDYLDQRRSGLLRIAENFEIPGQTAEDNYQEICLKLHLQWGQENRPTSSIGELDRWVAEVARNALKDGWRKAKSQKRQGRSDEVPLNGDLVVPTHAADDPAAQAESAEEVESLHDAISQLPPKSADRIKRVAAGASREEIREATGDTKSGLDSTLKRSREQLRRRLGGGSVGPLSLIHI